MRSISTSLSAIFLAAALVASVGCGGCKRDGGRPDSTATVDTQATHPGPSNTPPPGPPPAPTYTYEVVNSYPHDPAAFTEGLLYSDGFLYESTGMPGTSWLRKVELATGKVVKQTDLDARYFGEGLALFNGKLYQLTWQNQTGFVYDKDSFKQEKTFTYNTEGWGLTHDEQSLIMSDGTSFIRYLDPVTLQVTRTLPVISGNSPVNDINELEYVNGEIYANIWKTDRIARIDPGSGNVKGWIDLTGILSTALRNGKEDVLNGIAYDQMGDRLFVTGKYWSRIFEIKLKEQKAIASR